MSFMLEALQLAERGRYSVAPNPMVGCVIAKDGVIVGTGFHQTAGHDHAEIIALRAAGANARGATVYVTLEPCAHFGRTPPCVNALIAAQVAAVHIPFIDPNPLVAGQGVAKLRAAGIRVEIGEEAERARQQNEVFLFSITRNRPFVVAKWAMTLDGRITTGEAVGAGRWITGEAARRAVHYTRCELGAVLVGIETAIIDDPKLTPYLINNVSANPWRIVLDSAGRLPTTAAVLQHIDPQKTLVVTTEISSLPWRQQVRDGGAEVLVLPPNQNQQVDIVALLEELGQRKISGLLVEGGQKIFSSFFAANAVNKIQIYMAPKIIGGKKNFSSLGALDLSLDKANMVKNWKIMKTALVGNDVLVEAVPALGG